VKRRAVLEQQLCIRSYSGVVLVSLLRFEEGLGVHISFQAFLA
jgi:hypothetical protein